MKFGNMLKEKGLDHFPATSSFFSFSSSCVSLLFPFFILFIFLFHCFPSILFFLFAPCLSRAFSVFFSLPFYFLSFLLFSALASTFLHHFSSVIFLGGSHHLLSLFFLLMHPFPALSPSSLRFISSCFHSLLRLSFSSFSLSLSVCSSSFLLLLPSCGFTFPLCTIASPPSPLRAVLSFLSRSRGRREGGLREEG